MKISVPNAEIIFNDDILTQVKDLLREANQGDLVYLVTPYVRLDTRIKEAIEEARSNRVEIRFLIRKDADHSIEDVHWLYGNQVDVRQVKNLHAKIYISPKVAVIASMNLHTFSGSESKECGVTVRDEQTIEQLLNFVNKWQSISEKIDILAPATRTPPTVQRSEVAARVFVPRPATTSPSTKGYCIRCEKRKSFDKDYPLCDSCLKERKDWNKPPAREEEQKHCHRCGKPNLTAKGRLPSYAFPLCKECYAAERARAPKA